MHPIDNRIDRFCFKHPKLGIPRLIQSVLIGTVIVFLFDLFSGDAMSALLAFVPSEIFSGQVWRLITFVLVPGRQGFLEFALEVFFTWWVAGMVEQEWGSAKTTLFYCTGILINIVVGLVTAGVFALAGFSLAFPTAGVGYLNLSVFFAFATLLPELTILLFGLVPIKAKWLGWFTAVWMAYQMFYGVFAARSASGMASGLLVGFLQLIPALIAVANYFLFCWSHIARAAGHKKHVVKHRTSPQTINFKKAVKDTKERKQYLHKCVTCGRTDTDNPGLEFRYCSRCTGYHCYCMDHIGNHTHVE